MDSILLNAQEAAMSSLNIIIKRITFPEFDASQNARRKSYTFLFTIPLRAIWFVRHMFGMTCAIGTTTSLQKHFTFDALLPLRYYVPSIDKSQWRSILVLATFAKYPGCQSFILAEQAASPFALMKYRYNFMFEHLHKLIHLASTCLGSWNAHTQIYKHMNT